MSDPATVPAVHVQTDAAYLPLPNRVELVLTDVAPPDDLTPTSFVIGIADDGGMVMANHALRGVEITGGHREPGETPRQAARREGGEESGARYLTLWRIGYLRCVSQGTVPDGHPYPHPVGYQAIHAASVAEIERREDYLECLPPVVLGTDGIATLAEPLRSRLWLLHAAALSATGRDRTIAELAREARPVGGDERDSPRQTDALRRFLDECQRRAPAAFDDDGTFWKRSTVRTADETIIEALHVFDEATRR